MCIRVTGYLNTGPFDRTGYGGPLARTNDAAWTFGAAPRCKNLSAWTTCLHGHRGQDSVSCQGSDLLCDSGQKQLNLLPSFLLFFLPSLNQCSLNSAEFQALELLLSLPRAVYEGTTLIETSYLEEKDRDREVRESVRWGK